MTARVRMALLGCLLLGTQQCAPSESSHYVVLGIEDPSAVAGAADQLVLATGSGEPRTFERGGRDFPITVTLSAESPTVWDIVVTATSEGGAIASCAVALVFPRDDEARVSCVLAGACSEGVCEPPPPPPPQSCQIDDDCNPPPACALNNACRVRYCGDDGSCQPEAPRLTSVTPAPSTDTGFLEFTLNGVGFAPTATVSILGSPFEVVERSATQLTARLEAGGDVGGYLPIQAANRDNAVSNTAWLLAVPESGLIIEDYDPDYGVPEETFRVIGTSLPGNLMFTDGAGHIMTCGASTPVTWPGANGTEAVSCTLPDAWEGAVLAAFTGSGVIYTRAFTVGVNLASALNVTTSASSQRGGGSTSSAVADGDLATSWSSEAKCGSAVRCAWVEVALPTPQAVSRVSLRGSRSSSDHILVGDLELFGDNDTVVASRTVHTDRPFGDADVDFEDAVSGVMRVRFTSLLAESQSPGLAELEIFESIVNPAGP
ncbi:MAG: discoidin domain-containing protein [Myxococcota bacterium]